MSAGWQAGAARRWRAAQRLPDRVPLRIKLITAVLGLVAIALIAISVAGISFLRSYLVGQQDDALRVLGNSPQGAPAEVASCFSSTPCPSPAQRPGVAIDFVPDHGTLQRIWVPIRGYGSVLTAPGPAVGPYVAWLAAHP